MMKKLDVYELTGRAQKILRGTILLEPTRRNKHSNNFERKEKSRGRERGKGEVKIS